MLILRLHFWPRADGTWFVSRSCALISHSIKIKTQGCSAMSPVTQHVPTLVITITLFSEIAGVWEAFFHSFLWGHYDLCLYFSSVCIWRMHMYCVSQSAWHHCYSVKQLENLDKELSSAGFGFHIFYLTDNSYMEILLACSMIDPAPAYVLPF